MYLEFKEYLRIAERVVGKCTNVGIQNSEDNIAYVAEFLMVADSRYKEESGLTREEFRYLYAKYARLKLFKQKNKKRFENSLEWGYTNGKEGNEVRLVDVLEDRKQERPDKIVMSTELLEEITNSSISQKEKSVVIDYLFSTQSLAQIGRDNNISPRYVGRVIQSAIKKISHKLIHHT
jgi:hypothetical protein